MYYKQHTGTLLVRKSRETPHWVKWVHEIAGTFHCFECIKLDGCWFIWENAPVCPRHENCHCRLEAVDYLVVAANAETYSDFGKFDPYLFNTQGRHPHGKDKLFNEWGYTVDDARWLQAEIEKQALEKYLAGDYILGKLNREGQRISIRIAIPRRDGMGYASFVTGWMVDPNGKLRLSTPYGGK